MNWEQRIDAAEERGFFTDEEKKLAKDWNTCAFCEVADMEGVEVAPTRGNYKYPMDLDLIVAGGEFYDAIVDNDFAKARSRLHHVKSRANYLQRMEREKTEPWRVNTS